MSNLRLIFLITLFLFSCKDYPPNPIIDGIYKSPGETKDNNPNDNLTPIDFYKDPYPDTKLRIQDSQLWKNT